MFPQHLKYYRKKAKLTQKLLALKLGLDTSSIAKYETGQAVPSIDILRKISGELGVSADILLDIGSSSRDTEVSALFRLYQSANQQAKKTAVFALEQGQLIDMPEKKTVSLTPVGRDAQNVSFSMDWYENFPVSAGTGAFISGQHPVKLMLKKAPPHGATYICSIQGNSMEPKFNDLDKVFVKYQPMISIGQIGVFVVNGESYIKRLDADSLVSLNPAYPPISIKKWDEIVCCGQVLGVCDDSYLI